MELEQKQVLLKYRFNLLTNHREKEWWYVGISDEAQGVYCGFNFLRVNMVDSFHFVLFDSKSKKVTECAWKGFLDSEIPPGKAYLRHVASGVHLEYVGNEVEGWDFCMHYRNVIANLHINSTTPPFTKYDNKFVNKYSLLHFFHNRVNGAIQTSHRNYEFRDALGYYDHCFGSIPRESRWHWVAMQNEHFALASLVNYGASPQCYTQGFFTDAAPAHACRRWIRFDQDVSFEKSPYPDHMGQWKITSPEMDLQLSIIQHSEVHTRIPPLIPCLIKIDHGEHYVQAKGRMRVDGVWLETGNLYGVLEEHRGWW